MFNLRDVHECNFAVKQDLPIVKSLPRPPLAAAATTTPASNNLQHAHKTECNSLQFTVLCLINEIKYISTTNCILLS